jgi:hypothetical protein
MEPILHTSTAFTTATLMLLMASVHIFTKYLEENVLLYQKMHCIGDLCCKIFVATRFRMSEISAKINNKKFLTVLNKF